MTIPRLTVAAKMGNHLRWGSRRLRAMKLQAVYGAAGPVRALVTIGR
ncbi:MAG TPA: hypothetical protein VN776_08370 [Terracidiphilus sp.]|nr:hypothetical protein [Terracidiphilus sp.]